jgi:hypothetical protein
MKSCMAAFGAGVCVVLSVQSIIADKGMSFFFYSSAAALAALAAIIARNGGE